MLHINAVFFIISIIVYNNAYFIA